MKIGPVCCILEFYILIFWNPELLTDTDKSGKYRNENKTVVQNADRNIVQ